MKIVKIEDIKNTEREVKCPNGGFTSNRILLKSDGMGFGMTKTVIPPNGKQHWHYKNHLESCYCVSGYGILTDIKTGETYEILPDTTYVLDKNDDHYFEAIEEVVLICAFNPPLTGEEVHQDDGSYAIDKSYKSPVYDVKSVPVTQVTANDYNPNSVAPPEMALLETSIWEDGYTQPVVTVYDRENDKYVVIDGFHRFLTLMNSERIKEREKGMLPVV
jgi:L-ectoine synthase